MQRVLGTAVFEFEKSVDTAFLISDLHVPNDGGAAFAQLQCAVAAAVAARVPLFVLGDLFDSYVCRAQTRHGIWRDVAALFAGALAAGAPVVLLHGNRDFLLGGEFVRAGRVRLFPGGLRVRLGGVDTLLLHGDELCVNDLPYQRSKRWLRSAPVRWFARALPLGLGLRVGAVARNKSRMSTAGGDPNRFLPTHRALGAAFAVGVQRLVFGHIHRHARGPHGDGEYLVLPAFDATGVGFAVRGGAIEAVRFVAGGPPDPVPAAGPIAFPA